MGNWYEVAAYFWRVMQEAGHTNTELLTLEGCDHGSMARPTHPLPLKFVRAHR